MIPDRVIATINEIAACPSSLSMLDLISTKLQAIESKHQGVKVSRAGGGNICVLECEPRSPRAGPGSLVVLVKIPHADLDELDAGAASHAGPLQRSLRIHGDRVGGKGIAKALVIATVLDWLEGLPSPHLIGSARVVFYDWSDASIGAIDRFAAVLPVDHAFLWFMEPTGSMACPAEKGSGKISVTFGPPGPGVEGDLPEKLASSINDRFKPSHPVYPLDPDNRLSYRFLPGAQTAVATATGAGPMRAVHVAFSHHPLAAAFKQELVEHVNSQGKRLGAGAGLRVVTEHHLPGAMFDAGTPGMERFVAIHRRLFQKEPYVDWHVHPSMASAVYKQHPAAAAAILGPGDPYLVDDGHAVVSAREASDFRDLLEAVGEEYLFRT
ncbi:MAG: hypothetical protein JW839_11530 [Candidatus Lokiarchaeota archaeon]|nr:hypothetical protein [Candidatus Lokiarchaeota archaeon]